MSKLVYGSLRGSPLENKRFSRPMMGENSAPSNCYTQTSAILYARLCFFRLAYVTFFMFFIAHMFRVVGFPYSVL